MRMTNTNSKLDSRRDWLAVLAHAPRAALALHAQCLTGMSFESLREPELGLAMLRARAGNRGDRFNLGEATLTRCVVRHRSASGSVTAGVGYVLGRDAERAGWVARLDALLQQPEHHDRLMRELVGPLRSATQQRMAEQAARSAASRVHFYTLQPEANA